MVTRKKKYSNNNFLFFKISHITIGFTRFLTGFYTLPLITAEEKPSQELPDLVKNEVVSEALFVKDLKSRDFLYWGEGQISNSKEKIPFQDNLLPAPDYKLYFTKTFVTDEEDFLKKKNKGLKINAFNWFDGFLLYLIGDLHLECHSPMVIWCESFSKFITTAQYRN